MPVVNGQRPNPDVLLARVRDEKERSDRGKLRIFFGYAAGVGKTYAMLSAARRELAAGKQLLVGYVEPHGRPETEKLLDGLDILPNRNVEYRGTTLREFDLDAALAQRPQLILVDELAHTNAPGMRHPKRWQDVEELLAAGINVWTTLNVQHIESLNDVIAQITGVAVKETLPDTILERTDEIELIDIAPDKLMERLAAGKVYVPAQAERALQNFFQKGNLVALRELSLRQAASRVQQDVELARQERDVAEPWLTGERLLVCVGPSPTNVRIIRATKRLARSLGAEWLAVAVETGAAGRHSSSVKELTSRNLRFAEELGAETQVLVGNNVAEVLLSFARERNVTKVVAGKTAQPRWIQWFSRTIIDQLLEESGDIDVYVVSGEGEGRLVMRQPRSETAWPWQEYAWAACAVAICTFLAWGAHSLGLADANIVMIFLAGVAIVSARLGRGPAIASSVASVLTFDFFFVPPRLTLAVGDSEYLIMFVVMLSIGLVINELTARLQSQLHAAQQQERRTSQLFRMTRQLSELAGSDFLIRTAGRQIEEIFGGEVVIFMRESDDKFTLRVGDRTQIIANPVNVVVAEWVASNGKTAGASTDTLPNATALFVPLAGSQQLVGALGVAPQDESRFLDPDQVRLLETCGSLIALAVERDQSVLTAHEAQLQVQAEQLRNSLLTSVSHDLRTPLATISGTASGLLDTAGEQQREGLQTVVEESQRLARLFENLLDMARLDSGAVTLNKQWHVLEEIIGTALHSVRREVAQRPISVSIPDGFPLLKVDGFLLEQVLTNLLENAARYTPPGSQIEISAAMANRRAEIRVADHGPGLPPGTEQRVFDKFFRGNVTAPDGRRGVGLGLAICQAIVEAHGGHITAANRAVGGAEFLMTLPAHEVPPTIEAEAASLSTSG